MITAGGFLVFQNARAKTNEVKSFGYQSSRWIPISFDVDVAVVGGTTAAVAAAVMAARQGATVFLSAPEPYLGEDICGTYQLWSENEKATVTELGEKIFKGGLPTPMHVKKHWIMSLLIIR